MNEADKGKTTLTEGMKATPTGPAAGYAPYLPSCGTEMLDFYGQFCDKCQNPAELAWTWEGIPPGCPLIVEATAENKQPVPWVVKDGKPCCLDFQV